MTTCCGFLLKLSDFSVLFATERNCGLYRLVGEAAPAARVCSTLIRACYGIGHSRTDLLFLLMPLTKPGNQFSANSLRWFRCVDSAALVPLR
jgi:hypothetical protein